MGGLLISLRLVVAQVGQTAVLDMEGRRAAIDIGNDPNHIGARKLTLAGDTGGRVHDARLVRRAGFVFQLFVVVQIAGREIGQALGKRVGGLRRFVRRLGSERFFFRIYNSFAVFDRSRFLVRGFLRLRKLRLLLLFVSVREERLFRGFSRSVVGLGRGGSFRHGGGLLLSALRGRFRLQLLLNHGDRHFDDSGFVFALGEHTGRDAGEHHRHRQQKAQPFAALHSFFLPI